MQLVSELDLPHLAIQEPGFAADPIPRFAAARQHHPWLAKSDFGFIVHEYEAIRDLTWMDEKFNPSLDAVIEIMDAKNTPWGRFMLALMLSKDPPEHTRLRNSVASSFTPRTANRIRPLMRDVISDLLDEWVPRSAFDFADFASHFPIRVMFGLIGASPALLPGIKTSLETQGLSASLDKTLLPALEDAYRVLWQFVDMLVVERRRDGGGDPDDVLNRLLASQTAGDLDAEELRNMLIFLFAAGYDTSKNMLTLIMHVMIQHPEHWARCAEDRQFCDRIVEEVLRYHSVSNIYRTAREDIHYRGVIIPAGTILMLTLTVASRDPKAFPDADTFNPERRDPNRHVAFGRGIHICLGQHIARAQIQEAVHLIAQRIRHPRLAGEITWRPFPGVWGIRSLPIVFTPGAARTDQALSGIMAVV
jgi:cytochrome P450